MKKRPKTAFVLAAAIGITFLALLLPVLPITGEGYGCVGAAGNIGCAPDHASASFYLFGSGFLSAYLSTPHGVYSHISWCTAHPGGGGFGCQYGGFQVPWYQA
jgi:hypothetical protein